MWMATGTSADVAPSTDFTGSPLAVGCCSTCSLDLGFFAAMPGPGGNPMAGHQAWAWWPARRPVGREGSWHPLSQKARIPTYIHRCHCAPPHCNCSQPTLGNFLPLPPNSTTMHFVEHLSIVYITALPLRPCKCSQQQQQQLPCFSNSCLDLQNITTPSNTFNNIQRQPKT